MKRLRDLIEWGGSLLGLLWLFGPPSWQPINRGTTIALAVVLLLVLAFVAGVAIRILVDQRRPPYQI